MSDQLPDRDRAPYSSALSRSRIVADERKAEDRRESLRALSSQYEISRSAAAGDAGGDVLGFGTLDTLR